MVAKYTLYMKKNKSGGVLKSSLTDFGFAVSDIPWPNLEIQEVFKHEWPGEHGEDAYIPPAGLKIQAYDLEVKFCYKGALGTAYAKYKAFRNYLIGASGDGAELLLYDPYWEKGCAKAHLTSIGELNPQKTNADEILPLKATFRVTDPMTNVVAVKDVDGKVTNIGAA